MKTNKQLFVIIAVAATALGLAACATIPLSGMSGSESISVRLPIPTPDVSTDGPKLVSPIGLYFYENGQWGKRVEMVGGRYETEVGTTYRFTARALRSNRLTVIHGVVEWWGPEGKLLHLFPSEIKIGNEDLSIPYFTTWLDWPATHPSNPGVYATIRIRVEDENGRVSNIVILTPVVVVPKRVSPPAVPAMTHIP